MSSQSDSSENFPLVIPKLVVLLSAKNFDKTVMGNHVLCGKKAATARQKDEESLRKFSVLESTSSITLPSANVRRLSGSTLKQSVSTNTSVVFSWSRMQSLYLESTRDLQQPIALTSKILSMASKAIDDLREREVNMIASKLHASFDLWDLDFVKRFEKYVNKTPPPDEETLQKMFVEHTISVLNVHSKILKVWSNSDDERVKEVLKLLALSHLVMGVPPSEFRLMNIVIGRYMSRYYTLTEEVRDAVLLYLNIFTDNVVKYMERRSSESFLESTSFDAFRTGPRENYRQLKKWNTLKKAFHSDVDWKTVETLKEASHTSSATITTEELKAQDWVMKHFVKHGSTPATHTN